MKSDITRVLSALLIVLLCAPLLCGCGTEAETTGAATEIETTAPETSAAVTETATVTEEQTTEAETEAPPPELSAGVINLGAAEERDIASYFTKQRYCTVGFTSDKDEGRVLYIETKSVTKPYQRTPSLYFKYGDFCAAIGEDALNLSENPFVLIKIKAENVSDRQFGLLGAASVSETESKRTELFDRVPAGDGWNYIGFDFSGVKEPEKLNIFRLCFEQLAKDNGERVLISEFRVCTADEAAALTVSETYSIEEQTAGDYNLRLLQFNIQTENGNSAPFIIRSEMYRKLVDELKPDVVGMEEVTTNWCKWLDSYVFNDSYQGVGEPRTAGGEANPIYYRKDKFELVEHGTFWLSDTPDKAGSKIDGANYPRICTWAVLKDRATGVQFAHMNTHLDHNGNNDSTTGNNIRKAQMAVIVKFAQSFKDMPLFLSGDLNCRRTTSEGKIYALYKMITGQNTVKDEDGTEYRLNLADSRLDAPVTVDENHTATMTKYYDEKDKAYEPAREPIDYVFYNPTNTAPLTYETFLLTDNGCYISDHLPVFTTFKINC